MRIFKFENFKVPFLPYLLLDGKVVCWGATNSGGGVSTLTMNALTGVKHIFATWHAFAGLTSDGSLPSWGHSRYGGGQMLPGTNRFVAATVSAFSSIQADLSVIAWGHSTQGGSIPRYISTQKYTSLQSTRTAFVGLTLGGGLEAWGDVKSGGNNATIPVSANHISRVFGNDAAFAALSSSGTVITWGHRAYGGDSSEVASSISSGVKYICTTSAAFAAIKSDGSVITWGHPTFGGDSSNVTLNNVLTC